MRATFVEECVGTLFHKYGVGVSDIEIILPSKRASLFFNQALVSTLRDTPIWQPRYLSLGELFSELSGLVVAERIRLIAILYSIYSKYHPNETFDSFYYWGDMIINDFEAIDNYMIDAKRVFENSGDLRDIEQQFDYLTPEHREEVARFWGSFNAARDSKEKLFFMNIWRTLYPIYNEYKTALKSHGIGYSAMICREVAEWILSGDTVIDSLRQFAVIGFNALSTTERVLLDALKKGQQALFMWDSDISYLNSDSNEAGIFLKRNIQRYGEDNQTTKDNYSTEKNITVLRSPSKSLECKYVWHFLEECYSRAQANGKVLGAETAIILTDESLLMSVLNSIPPFVENINVTAGYQLRLTVAYNLIEAMVSLQRVGQEEFYYKDVEAVLANPLVISAVGEDEVANLRGSLDSDILYYKPEQLAVSNLFNRLFTKVTGWVNIGNYLLWVINRVAADGMPLSKEEREALYRCYKAIEGLSVELASIDIPLSDTIYYSLLRKHLSSGRISFEGEPLIGVQVMGILESRTLDFENVLILSVEEENFPVKGIGASFIPATLRDGYGLPTIGHHQSIYAYYFYRLIQRANKIDISYVASSEETSSGEPTRYIYQLDFNEQHSVKFKSLTFDLSLVATEPQVVIKQGRAKEFIEQLLAKKVALSPSSFYDYIECPMRFYYKRIEGIKPLETEREQELDGALRGTILHSAIEEIYTPLCGATREALEALLSKVSDEKIVSVVDKIMATQLGENAVGVGAEAIYAARGIVRAVRRVIDYDITKGATTIDSLECKVKEQIGGVNFFGVIDRLDREPNGGYMIIDYKSGGVHKCDSIDSIFDRDATSGNKPYFQSLLYSLMVAKNRNCITTPALFFTNNMAEPKYSPLLQIKGYPGGVNSYSEVAEQFEEHLLSKIGELLSLEQPFVCTDNRERCKYCDYLAMCKIF